MLMQGPPIIETWYLYCFEMYITNSKLALNTKLNQFQSYTNIRYYIGKFQTMLTK